MIFHTQRQRYALWRAEREMQLIVDDVAADLREVQDAYMITWRQKNGFGGMVALSAAYRLSCISPLLDAHLDLYEQAQMCQQTQLITREKPFKYISNLTTEMVAPVLQLQLSRAKVREDSPRVALRCLSRIKNSSETDMLVAYSEADLSRALEDLKAGTRGGGPSRLTAPSLAFTIKNSSKVVKLSPAAPPIDFVGGVVQTDDTLKETRTSRATDDDSIERAGEGSKGAGG